MMNIAEWTPMELLISSVWKEVLDLDEVVRDQDFVDLGGHSLLALRVAFKCQKLLNKRVTAAQVLRFRTVAALAQALS